MLFFFSCKPGKKEQRRLFTNQLEFADSVDFGKKLRLETYNFYGLWPTSATYRGKTVFCFLSGISSIHLLDAETLNLADSIILPALTPKAKMYLRNDSLFIYYHPFFYTCILNDKEFIVARKLKTPAIDYKHYSIESFGAFLADRRDPVNVVFGYGIRKAEQDSYLDRDANLIRFSDSSGFKRMGYFPKDFFSGKHYNNAILLNIDTTGNFILGFEDHDSIFKIDAGGRIIAAGKLEGNGDGSAFDWEKESDLAYVRRYTWEAELNQAIHVSANNYIIVLKKLHEPNVSKPQMYRYMVFDADLKLKYADSIRQVINPNFIFNYKNGIALLSLATDKMYYYKIP